MEELVRRFLIVALLGSDHQDIENVINEKNDSASFSILLNVALFGKEFNTGIDDNKKKELAVERAYRDFCRTIRKGEKGINEGIGDLTERKKKTAQTIIDELSKMELSKMDFDKYNEWHDKLCEQIIANKYTYGQAQKWVNMAMKYLIVLGDADVIAKEKLLHIPLDSIIIDIALKNKLLTQKTLDDNHFTSWSGITDKKQYDAIQNEIRDNLKNQTPIIWEFQAWNDPSAKDK